MGRVNAVLTPDTEAKLRKKAYEKFGLKKGSISLAVEDAIKKWLKE